MPKVSNSKKEKLKEVLAGTIRIRANDLLPYEKIKRSWKRSSRNFPEAELAIKLFNVHNNLGALVDKKNPRTIVKLIEL